METLQYVIFSLGIPIKVESLIARLYYYIPLLPFGFWKKSEKFRLCLCLTFVSHGVVVISRRHLVVRVFDPLGFQSISAGCSSSVFTA